MPDHNAAPAIIDNQSNQLPDLLTPEEQSLIAQHGLQQIVVVDASQGVQQEAVDLTDAYINAETSQGGMSGLFKKIWKGNLAHDYVRLKHIGKNRESIIDSGNLYVDDDSGQSHDEAMTSVVTRFTEDLLKSGETSQSMQETEAGRSLSEHITALVKDFAGSDMAPETLQEERTRILSAYGKGLRKEDRNKGLLFADNILEVAQAARAAVNHGLGIDRLDKVIGGTLGEARLGAETAVARTRSDKVLDSLYSSKIGSLVNETTLLAAVAVGATIAKFTTRKVVTAAAATISLGVGAGVMAGAREHRRIAIDRATHMREHAVSAEVASSSGKRRDQIEETRYDSVAASDLDDRLADALAAVDAADPATIEELKLAYSELDTRLKLSDEQSIDLIRYDSKSSLETQRLDLMRANITARKALRENGVSDESLAEISEQSLVLLREGVSERDAIFRSLQRKQTAKMAAIGFVSGLAVGETIQEVKALFSEELQGVFEGNNADQQRRTLLAAMFKSAHHHNGASHPALIGHESKVNNNLSLGLPSGYETKQINSGQWGLVGPDGKTIVDNLGYDANGHISADAIANLHEHGINISNSHVEQYATHHTVTDIVTQTPAEYRHAHPELFTTIHRELWYDNNTPSDYDRNELRLDWGGHDSSGINADGNYVMNVHDMLPDGSFHGPDSANAQSLLAEGKLALALSFDRNSQSHVMLVHFDKAGNAIIDAKSFAGRSLFINNGGKAEYHGGFAEAVQLMGKNPKGGESVRMLATVVGDNHPKPGADRVSHIITTMHERTVADLSVAEQTDLPVEVPIPIPLYGRSGLESDPRRNETDPVGPYYNIYLARDSERQRQWEAERSPRLRANADALLNPQEELDWYADELVRRRGQEYADELNGNIAASPELQNLDENIRAIVVMPVAALKESDNIYNALSLYGQQPAESLEKTVVLLNLNWVDEKMQEPGAREAFEKTLSEIERARRDFPDVKIATFTKEWSKEWIDSVRHGHMYGEVIKTLYDTAAIAVQQAMRDGRMSPSHETIMITNDADAEGIAWNYFERYIETADDHPEQDAFVGQIRWGTGTYFDYPGYGVSNWVMQTLNLMSSRAEGAEVHTATIGPNSAFRMSTYAAVGGCIDANDMGAGADSELGRKMLAARGVEVGPAPSGGYGTYTQSRGISTRDASRRTSKKIAKVIGVVTGAEVDSAADRLLKTYRKGKWLGSAWEKFDAGESRELNADDEAQLQVSPENVRRNFAEVQQRIERQITDFVTWWYPNAGLASWSLEMLFPSDESGRAWSLSAREGMYGDQPKTFYDFKFSRQGARQLRKRLLDMENGRSFAEQHKYAMYSGPSPTLVGV